MPIPVEFHSLVPRSVNVTSASTPIFQVDTETKRSYTLLVNDSDEVMYISSDDPATLHSGIRLNALGGSYEMSPRFGNMYMEQMYAIHGGIGDKVLLVLEGF